MHNNKPFLIVGKHGAICDMKNTHTDESKANALYIVTACNEYDKLREENKQLSDIHTTVYKDWEFVCNKLKEDNKRLLELVTWISKVTNCPEIGIKCDQAIKTSAL